MLNPEKEFTGAFNDFRNNHMPHRVFADFCELAALSIANFNSMDPEWSKREARYMEIIKAYSKPEQQLFPVMLACVVEGLAQAPCDFLGKMYMSLEISNKHAGQFFTPYELSKACAMMLVDPELFKQKEFVTISEPACGSAGMCIAMCEALALSGINYQKRVHITAEDIAPNCVHMAYIQLSLMHVPAVIIHRNTLSMQEYGPRWYTPAHQLDLWNVKLRRGPEQSVAVDLSEESLVRVVVGQHTGSRRELIEQLQALFNMPLHQAVHYIDETENAA
jgi:hypothetical protein